MTSRERFVASLQCKPVDRFFRFDHGSWPTTRERWIKEGYPAETDFLSYFQFDPLVSIGINSGYTNSPYHPKFKPETVEETSEYRIYTDSDGVLKKELKTARDTSMPQFIKFPVAERKDWKTVMERLNPGHASARIGDPERLKRACHDPAVPTLLRTCGTFGHARNLFGDEGLSYVIFDDPALLEEILENWLALYTELLKELTRMLRVDSILVWEDMCYKNGPLMSPEHFRQFMLPPYRKFVEEARRCGVEAVIVDTDGDCRKMIPVFLDAGVDALLPFEVQAGMDVVQVRRDFPTLGIIGGLDKRALAGSRGDIRREVDRVMSQFDRNGGFIPTLDHTVPPN
ncbi:uroporphyrinogen decarboxylase family protein, partial [Verrucomicrobiota bacterium]